MLQIEYLFIFSHFLVKLDAGFVRETEGSHHNNALHDENLVVTRGSHIYIQMPGDKVLFGELQYFSDHIFPSWAQQTNARSTMLNYAYVRMPDGVGLITSPVLFHNGHHLNFQEHRCFIKTQNNTIFGAFLENNNNALNDLAKTRVFVRISGQQRILSGLVHRADGLRPAWLP